MSKRYGTANQQNFAKNVEAPVRLSTFLRPSSLKTSFNAGKLIPVYSDEVLPGDVRKISLGTVTRLSTPIFPTMDDLVLEFMAFFVPNRLVWSGWEELCGENKTSAWTPSQAPALVPGVEVPTDINGDPELVKSKSIADYYGVPVGMDYDSYFLNCLRFRGYCLIYNEWFRDENTQAPIPLDISNNDIAKNLAYHPNRYCFNVNKFHDYFTSALPAPQKGDSPLIPISLNEVIPVITSSADIITGTQVPLHLRKTDGNSLPTGTNYAMALQTTGTAGDSINYGSPVLETGSSSGAYDGNPAVYPSNLVADPRNITSLNDTTISQLRTLFQIQKLYERDARGGTRYIEMLKAHFGVDAGDYRLQRPEFLGRVKTKIGMQSVPQTSSTDATSPQGNLSAYSYTNASGLIVDKSFVEHGFIHIFAIVRNVKSYQQGLDKSWSRRERFDYYYPTLAHISEQPIYNKEIYALGNDGDEVFGYQEAWADYRYKPNLITGSMRTNSVDVNGSPDSLDAWHYADWYVTTPVLSSGFITDNTFGNLDRTLAVSGDVSDQIRAEIKFMDVASRPMPTYSVPGLVDHF